MTIVAEGDPKEARDTASRDGLAAACLFVIGLAAVLHDILGISWAALAALPVVATYFILCWRELRQSTKVLLAVTFILSLYAVYRLGPGVFPQAVARGIFFLGFLALLGLLREAAGCSSSFGRAGEYLVTRSPGQRYAALTLGGHAFGALLSLGGFALILDTIRRANTLRAANGRQDIVALRERRMVTAVLRGFVACPFWSPLAISMAVVLANLPTLSWRDLALTGFFLGSIFVALGWLIDRWQSPAPGTGREPVHVKGGLASFLIVIAHVVVLSLLTLAVEESTHLAFQKALLVVVPVYALAWAAYPMKGFGIANACFKSVALLAAGARLNYPRYANEAAIFASSTYLGVLLAALVPVTAVSDFLVSGRIEPALMPSFLCLAITSLSIAGINPMISVSIAAATLAQITIPGVSQREIALALLASWAISAVLGPFISTTLMASSVFDKDLTTIAWRWNGLFGFVVLLTFCLLFYFVEF